MSNKTPPPKFRTNGSEDEQKRVPLIPSSPLSSSKAVAELYAYADSLRTMPTSDDDDSLSDLELGAALNALNLGSQDIDEDESSTSPFDFTDIETARASFVKLPTSYKDHTTKVSFGQHHDPVAAENNSRPENFEEEVHIKKSSSKISPSSRSTSSEIPATPEESQTGMFDCFCSPIEFIYKPVPNR